MHNITNKNSSAKTVAGENTTENFNEHAEAAPVINQSNNKETIMEETVFQSSMAPQVGVNETALGIRAEGTTTVSDNESTTGVNSRIEAIDTSTVAVLLASLGDKIPKTTRKVCMSYLEAKNAGLKICFFKFNREVNNCHIQALYKSLKDSKRFTRSCYVVPLRPILESFKDIEVYDLDGNQITLDTPDIELYLAVYDGQHRLTVCELHYGKVDVELELNEFDGRDPLSVIKDMNFCSRNWNGQDLRDSNVATGISTNQLYKEAKTLQGRHNITSKLAEYVLTFIREATKKQDLIEGKDTTMYNEANAKRGIGIFEACITNLNGDKAAKKLELIHAVVSTHSSISDKEKLTFARKMKLFMGTLGESECNKIKELIEKRNFGDLNRTIKEGYNAFCKLGHSEEELTQMEAELDKRIAAYIKKVDEENLKKTAKKPLKSGRVCDIINHAKAVKSRIDKEELENAESAAKEAFKKAEEAQKRVDELKAKNFEPTAPNNFE